MIRKIFGFTLITVGIILGLYIGLWLCFIGGIVQIINEIKSPDAVDAVKVGIGVGRIIFAGAVGWLVAISGILPGIAVLVKERLPSEAKTC